MVVFVHSLFVHGKDNWLIEMPLIVTMKNAKVMYMLHTNLIHMMHIMYMYIYVCVCMVFDGTLKLTHLVCM